MNVTNAFRAGDARRKLAVLASASWLYVGLIAWHQIVLRTLAVS